MLKKVYIFLKRVTIENIVVPTTYSRSITMRTRLSFSGFYVQKPFLKIISLLLGYWMWSCVSSYQVINYSYTVPLCFYNTQNKKIEAPETVTVCLRGYKVDILQLDTQQLVAHVSAHTLEEGTHYISVSDSLLLLPDTIKMVHCTPSPIKVHVSSYDSIQA